MLLFSWKDQEKPLTPQPG